MVHEQMAKTFREFKGKRASYHFDCGDSSKGTIGFCARVTANSALEALAVLQIELVDEGQIDHTYGGGASIEYARFFIGVENITLADIDEVELVEN